MEKNEWIGLLKTDLQTFNNAHRKWWEQNYGQKLNLTGADLRWADLTGADLTGANFSGADLSEANLSGANLRWADFSGANLSEANLSGANLRWADFSGANLRWAKSIIRLTGHDERGFELFLVAWGDGPHIKAGCHWFTMAEALAHWGSADYPDIERGQRYVDAIKLAAGWLTRGDGATWRAVRFTTI